METSANKKIVCSQPCCLVFLESTPDDTVWTLDVVSDPFVQIPGATTSHKGSEFSFVSTFKFRVDKEQIRALTQAQKHVVNCCGCVGHVATLMLR